ncbi:hypothetical protein CMK22_03470 [Candidatus Poribacteria bacterium]|nr:hypothetical protein [Candidatus Poribacteria bacterium]
MSHDVLYCFYDLSVSPPSYDFFVFMQTAELHRKRYDLAEIHFVFVPGPKEGFRDDSFARTIPQRYALMRNVVIPACWLLPSCNGVSWLQGQDEISPILENANHIFPRGYTLQRPVNDYLRAGQTSAYLRGETLTRLQEPAEYTQMVSTFLANKMKSQKLITVTIRDAPYDNQRNTNFLEWSIFLQKLDPTEYKVIIVPDTFSLWSRKIQGFDYCEMASVNILFRTALYRQAYLNMFVAQGPCSAAFHSGSPILMFGPVNTDVASTKKWRQKMDSLEPDEHNQYAMFKVNQRIAWGLETAENIEEEFSRFVSDFPESPIQRLEEHGIQSKRQSQLMCEAALEYTVEKIRFHQVIQEDIDTLRAIIKLDEKFIGAKHLLGMIASNMGQYETAVQLFDNCIELSNGGCRREIIGRVRFQSDGSNTIEYHLLKAEVLERADNLEMALQEYLKIREIDRENYGVLEKVLELDEKLKMSRKG